MCGWGEESVRRFFEDCLLSQIALDPNEHETTARSKPCMKWTHPYRALIRAEGLGACCSLTFRGEHASWSWLYSTHRVTPCALGFYNKPENFPDRSSDADNVLRLGTVDAKDLG
jgi:hypothetical protein